MRRAVQHLRSAARRAYTLTELLVVVAIFVIVLVIAIPAFQSMLYGSEQSLAENALRQGLASARDRAARGRPGEDTAAVFFFEPGGRSSIVTCVKAGEMVSVDPTTQERRTLEIFAPASGAEPVQMPRGWSVRGYARPNMIDDTWYDRTYPSAGNVREQGAWVFPENGFYWPGLPPPGVGPPPHENPPYAALRSPPPVNSVGDRNRNRNTFMVRFEGGSGHAVTSSPRYVLVLAAVPEDYRSVPFSSANPWNLPGPDGRALLRVDQESDAARFVARALALPRIAPTVIGQVNNAGTQAIVQQAQLDLVLGTFAADIVRAKAVGQLAVYSESRLARGLGLRLDRATDSLYQPATASEPHARWIGEWGPNPTTQQYELKSAWIEGRRRPGSAAGDDNDGWSAAAPDARIFAIARYQGSLVEMTGSEAGRGVQP